MLQSLHLKNFKGFQDQQLPLAPLTLLTGLNSSGKSTVLQALLLLRQSHQQGSLDKDEIALNGSLVQIGTARDALYRDADQDEITLAITTETHGTMQSTISYKPSTYQANVLPISAKQWAETVRQSSLFTGSFHYLEAERLGPRVTTEISDYQVQQRHLGTKGEWTAYFLHCFGEESIANLAMGHPQAQSPALKHQVEAWLGEVSPGTQLHTYPNTDIDMIRLRFSFSAEGATATDPYRPTNVGFGLTYTLPILVSILSSQPGALVLLENPEAHLHPQGQRQLGHLFALAASCGVQLIVETHSDHVLNGMRLAVRNGHLSPKDTQIHFFRRMLEDGTSIQVETPTLDDDGRFSHWPDGFFDEWDKSLQDLLLPKG